MKGGEFDEPEGRKEGEIIFCEKVTVFVLVCCCFFLFFFFFCLLGLCCFLTSVHASYGLPYSWPIELSKRFNLDRHLPNCAFAIGVRNEKAMPPKQDISKQGWEQSVRREKAKGQNRVASH